MICTEKNSINMKKPNLAAYIAFVKVVVGLIFQFLEMGLFGENPVLGITKYYFGE